MIPRPHRYADPRLDHAAADRKMVIPLPQSLSLRDYHLSRKRWSSSRLKLWREDPYYSYGLWFADPPLYRPDPPTPPQVIGSAVHDILARAGGIPSRIYGVTPEGHPFRDGSDLPKTRREKKLYQGLLASYPEKLILTEAELEEAQLVADALLEPRFESGATALALLTGEGGYSEYLHQWKETVDLGDGNTVEIPCQQLVDRVTPVKGKPAHVEIKTTTKRHVAPSRFRWEARHQGYDDQAAWNLRGLERLFGFRPLSYMIAVAKDGSKQVSLMEVTDDGFLIGSEKGRYGRVSSREELTDSGGGPGIVFERLAVMMQDAAGSKWGMPWELLEDGMIPEL